MLTWLNRNRLLFMATLLILVTAIIWLMGQRDEARTQYVAPDPAPSAMATATSVTPSSSAPTSPIDTPTQATDPQPGDKPVEVAVTRGDEHIVMPVAISDYTSFTGRQVWSPQPGTAEWYQVDDYPKPGTSSTLKSIIAAHVAYSGEPDVFANLEAVEVGDEVIVTYASKQTYTFIVTAIIVDDKVTIRDNQDIWGYAADEQRSTVLFTCDDQSGYRLDGHRRDNRAVIATIVE